MNKPLKLTIVVALTGVLWILLSDYFLKIISEKTGANFILFSSIKGLIYIGLISFVTYKISSFYFKQLNRSQKSYQNMFYNNPHPMYIVDTETLYFLDVNKAATKKYGYNRDEFRQMKITAIRSAEDGKMLEAYMRKMPDSEYHSGIWRHVTKSGEVLHVDIYSMIITFKGKKARLATAYDLTEITTTRQLLEQERHKLQKLIDHQTNFLLWVTPSGEIVFSNQHFNETFANNKTVAFKNLADIALEGEKVILFESLSKANIKGITSLTLQYNLNDETRHVKWEFIKINNSDDSPTLIQASGTDITQMKLNETKVLDQNRRLSEIAWMASHEIRRPVANLLGIYQLYDHDNSDNPENPGLIAEMEKATKELDQVIHNINEKTDLVGIKSSLHS